MLPRRPQPGEPQKLARAYVPFQRYERTWDPFEGLAKGTIFPELYEPYVVRRREGGEEEEEWTEEDRNSF